MTTPLQLAAIVLLTTAMAPLRAQVHSPQVNLHHRSPTEDLSWMSRYLEPAPGDENGLAHDPRFTPFLEQHLTAPQSFWKTERRPSVALAEVARDFLAVPGSVLRADNRYLTLDGCVQHFCPDRGLLWIDTGLPHPLVAFAAIDWITENRATDDKHATYTMWVFSNRSLDPTHLPPPLVSSIATWTNRPSSGSTDLQNITRVFLVDPDGTPHPLTPAKIGAYSALPAETATTPPNPQDPRSIRTPHS